MIMSTTSLLENSVQQTVLVVDDEPINIQLVYEILKENHQVLMATSGLQAIEMCKKSAPDLVLMDVQMPELSGLETCRIMKKITELTDIPIIFLTGMQKQLDEDACWNVGCVDFITKPFNFNTLKNRVSVHLTLKKQKELLRLQAFNDGLTGIKNRRYFDQYCEQQIALVHRNHLPLALLIIDIDFFKQFNDKLDSSRNESFISTYPEYASWYNNI